MPSHSAANQTLNVALIQYAPLPDYTANRQQTEQLIREAAQAKTKLIVLPELHTGAYFCQTANPATFEQAEPIDGPTAQWLANLAKELNVVIVGSIFEKRIAGVYHNTAIVLETDGSLAGYYRKMHIPDDPGYYEKFYFTPGDADPGLQPIQTSIGRIGLLVCWDQWFPEAARAMALAGADLLVYPTAIGWDETDTEAEQARQLDAWQTVQRGHAIANGLPVLSCNRIGYEADPSAATAGAQFWGHSFVAGPQGEWLAKTDITATTLTATLDLSRTTQVRNIWPFLRDRRIDAYDALQQRSI